MQESKNSHTRKRWYQRAIEASMIWKLAISKPIDLSNITSPWKTLTKTAEINNSRKLRKCTSTRVASSFSHVCLCAPISSSYSDVFQGSAAPPRRSFSYRGSRSTRQEITVVRAPRSSSASARMSVEGRRIFRGKSLTDDVLMRRFVIDEEKVMRRRRNEMEIIRRRSGIMRFRTNNNIGPSPLSRMVLAQ